MNQLQKMLQTVAKSLQELSKKVENIQKQIGGAQKKPAQKVAAKAAKPKAVNKASKASQKPKAAKASKASKAPKTAKSVPTPPKSGEKKEPSTGTTAYDLFLKAFEEGNSGTSISDLKVKTGFDDKKIANLVYKAKKQGKIKNVGKGVYSRM